MFSRTLEAEHGKMPPPKARAVHESFAQFFLEVLLWFFQFV